jgi:hypothetical protein
MMDAIRIWRDSPHTMGAIFGPNLMEGEAEFMEIAPPYGKVQQYFAAIDAVRKLERRLGIADQHLPLIWSTIEAERPQIRNLRECKQIEEEEEPDPADWWKQ